MRRFQMVRVEDETGISGTGHVADGVLFDDGRVAIRWRTATPGVTIFDSLDHAKAVHGHGGKTIFAFVDHDGEMRAFCPRCFADDQSGSWGHVVIASADHCTNCGSGGVVTIPAWAVDSIRKQASWVGKRYYPNDEDLETNAELTALRTKAGVPTGRTIELRASDDGPAEYWSITQKKTDGWISTTSPRLPNETAEQALMRTVALLPHPADSEKGPVG